MELILDASAEATAIGLADRGTLTWTTESLDAQQHTQQLLPAILRALRQTGTTFQAIRLIVMALGPGPFNGLRVAAATAKGIAVGSEAALVGVPTMRAEAYRCPSSMGTVRPVLRAGRAGFGTALFRWQGDTWEQVEDLSYVGSSDIDRLANGRVPLCGDAAHLPHGQNQHQERERPTRLQTLALLGWHDYVAGRTVTPAALQPIYLRPPHITTPRDRRH